MEAKELRIGNWYSNGQGFYTLGTSAFIDYLNEAQVNNGIIENIFPIPLTPEILEKCGLPDNDGILSINDKVDICFERRIDKLFLIAVGDESTDIREILYLHDLQNLYFALSSKELQINL